MLRTSNGRSCSYWAAVGNSFQPALLSRNFPGAAAGVLAGLHQSTYLLRNGSINCAMPALKPSHVAFGNRWLPPLARSFGNGMPDAKAFILSETKRDSSEGLFAQFGWLDLKGGSVLFVTAGSRMDDETAGAGITIKLGDFDRQK
jgi:hypothetical protein